MRSPPTKSLALPDFQALSESLMPGWLFEPGSMGATFWHEHWAQGLLHMATGTAQPKDGGGLVLSDGEQSAVCWATSVFVHDNPEMEALAPDGMVDGHVLFVSAKTLEKRCADPQEAARWMRQGALTCARVALGVPQEEAAEGWKVVSREQLREVLARHPKAERLLSILPNTPEQDAWRYASAVIAYGASPEGELMQKAVSTPEAELDAGWTNQHWAPFLVFESEHWQWKKNGALIKGIRAASHRMAPLLLDRESPTSKWRMANLLLSQFGGSQSLTERLELTNGIATHPSCTSGARALIVEVASIYDGDSMGRARDRAVDPNAALRTSVKHGWENLQDRLAREIKSQYWWMRALREGQNELFLPAMAGRVSVDPTEDIAQFWDDWGQPSDHLAKQVKRYLGAGLKTARNLPQDALVDLATWAPAMTARWLASWQAGESGEQRAISAEVIYALTDDIDLWMDHENPQKTAQTLRGVFQALPDDYRFDMSGESWWGVMDTAVEYPAFRCLLDEMVKRDSRLPQQMLMVALDHPYTGPEMIQYIVNLGADPQGHVEVHYDHGEIQVERLSDQAWRSPNAQVRALFQPAQDGAPSNVVSIRARSRCP